MKLFTRLTASISAEADRAVSRFENHDAIAAAAVRSAKESVTAARVRHARLQREGARQRESLAALQQDEARWTERARASADSDEANALACLERRRITRMKAQDFRRTLNAHDSLEAEMADRLASLERRLTEITHRRDTLRSRESIVRAGEVLDTITRDDGAGIEDVFERWEVRIADTGSARDLHDDGMTRSDDDSLERRYAALEHEASLKAELGALVDDGASADVSEALGDQINDDSNRGTTHE